jgi:hypothetical protein
MKNGKQSATGFVIDGISHCVVEPWMEKHVLINAPDEGSEYYNYKGFNSIVLMAVADYKYCFSYFEVGKKGSESDGRVFQNCSLLKLLENGLLPTGSFLVGDDTFPLKP